MQGAATETSGIRIELYPSYITVADVGRAAARGRQGRPGRLTGAFPSPPPDLKIPSRDDVVLPILVYFVHASRFLYPKSRHIHRAHCTVAYQSGPGIRQYKLKDTCFHSVPI
jgi:hypothetical protein